MQLHHPSIPIPIPIKSFGHQEPQILKQTLTGPAPAFRKKKKKTEKLVFLILSSTSY